MKTGTRFISFVIGALLVILSGTTWAQPSYPSDEWLEKKCLKFVKEMNDREKKCVEACDLKRKLVLINQMIKIQRKIDILPVDCPVETLDSLCGGILNVENTPIEVVPSSLKLDIDESRTLNATLEGTCKDGGNLTGEIGWWSFDHEIADITQDGLVTGKANGCTFILAFSLDIPAIMSIPVEVVVGDLAKVDIAFLIDTNGMPTNQCNFPSDVIGTKFCSDCFPMVDFAAEYRDALEQTYGGKYRAALYSYSVHEELCFWGPWEGCAEPSYSPCYAFKTHSTNLTSETDFINTFNTLRTVCNNTGLFNCYTGSTPCYIGSSVYTALMRVIDEYPWSEDAKKVILLVGYLPAGLYTHPLTCEPIEPISGLTRNEVIQHAVENDIKIMAIKIPFWESYTTCGTEEYSTLAESTGGFYYPDGYYDRLHIKIIKAIEDTKLLQNLTTMD